MNIYKRFISFIFGQWSAQGNMETRGGLTPIALLFKLKFELPK